MNIVLFEPEIPQNTGNIARTCAATGAVLHLVEPLGFSVSERAIRRAGLDYWDKMELKVHKNQEAFFKYSEGAEYWFFSTKAPRQYGEVSYSDDAFLVFGKETRGLDESLLQDHIDHCVRIPMRETIRSLNLSNSVAIAVYEVLRQKHFADLELEGKFKDLL